MKYILFLLIIFNGCGYFSNSTIDVKPENGIWNLTNINFSEDENIELHEGWKFYSNAMIFERLEPFDVKSEIQEGCIYNSQEDWKSKNPKCNSHKLSMQGLDILNHNSEYLVVSSFHNWEELDESIQKNTGTAVYRLDLFLPEGEFGLFQENWPLSSAGRLWILENRKKLKLLATVGYPSISKETTRPMWKGISTDFTFEGGEVSLLFEVANYHHRSGYLGYALNLSSKKNSQVKTIFYHQEQMILFGFILMVGLYSIILFILRTKQTELFWFSMLCFSIAFRIILVSRIYQFYFPKSDNFEVLLKLEYLTFSFTPVFFILFIRYLLKENINKKLFYISLVYPIPISILILFTESSFFSRYLLEAIFSIILCIFFGMYEVVVKWNHGDRDIRYTIRTLSVVFTVFSLSIANDILISYGIYQFYELSGLGLIIFIFGQAAIIAKNNSNAWNRTDKLNFKIIQLNSELDEKIEKRTLDLQYALNSRMKDLQLAKEIQKNLMPTNYLFRENLNIYSYYRPMDEVGGDLYEMNQLGDNILRIFIADATGHGVQAGLITMLIKSEYDNIKFYSDPPNFILQELNKRYIGKYRYLHRFFTCAIVDIDLGKGTFKFASAGHPGQLFYDSHKIEELEFTGPLMGFLPDAKFKLISRNFSQGSKFLFFTDGAFEQFNEKNEILGEEKILEIFVNITANKCIFNDIPELINNWINQKRIRDDICIIGIDVLQQ